jgi:hypothetical protein
MRAGMSLPVLAALLGGIGLAAATAPGPASGAVAGAARPVSTRSAKPVAGYGSNLAPAGYSYDSRGGAASVQFVQRGLYLVRFPRLSPLFIGEADQTTVYGTGAECYSNGANSVGVFSLQVNCVSLAGNPVDARFGTIVARVTSPPHGFYSYVSETNLPLNYSGRIPLADSYNSAGKRDYVRRLGTGRYRVSFGGPTGSGRHGTASVKATGEFGGNCMLAGWHGTRHGQVVYVDCYASGARYGDTFTVLYARSTNLMAVPGATTANVLVGPRGRVLTQYDSTARARISARRLSVGQYRVRLKGLDETSANHGNVQVTAVGDKDALCAVDGWGPQLDPVVDVTCSTEHGKLTDSAFTLQYVVATTPPG